MEAVQIRLLFVDDNRPAITVNISVVIALVNDDGFVTVLMITVADHVTITVPVTISVTLSNRHANGTNTNPDLFRANRHCAENSSDGGDHYGILYHCVLLSLLSSVRANARTPGTFRVSLGAGWKETGAAWCAYAPCWALLFTTEQMSSDLSHSGED
jgi:hypothetical protein